MLVRFKTESKKKRSTLKETERLKGMKKKEKRCPTFTHSDFMPFVHECDMLFSCICHTYCHKSRSFPLRTVNPHQVQLVNIASAVHLRYVGLWDYGIRRTRK